MSFPRRPVRKHGIYRRRLVVQNPNMTVLKAIDSSPLQFYARNNKSLRTCENRKNLLAENLFKQSNKLLISKRV